MITITPKVLQAIETFRSETLNSLQGSRLEDDLTIQLQYHINKTIDEVTAKAIESNATVTVTTVKPASTPASTPAVNPPVAPAPVYYAIN